ncbi:SOS response-associated peptidase family protein [Stenotrophomonas bentonitica]|uniref:SOS response-associated peptidase family protein n=1 Tax=Stenotrophomonas bentonitica TaxID=1450134 RepID=UPI0037D4919D
MCYSAQIKADYHKLVRDFGAVVSMDELATLYAHDPGKKRPKTPKAMDDAFAAGKTPVERSVWAAILDWNARDATTFAQELFTQNTRLVNAERALQTKVTKKAENDVRVATNKIARAQGKLADLRRTDHVVRDSRIFPGVYGTVIVSEGGKRVVKPMRYQCRLAGKTSSYDQRYPGTYNARRDSLEDFWRLAFGYTHALMVVDTFYENVEGPDGGNQVVQFTPRTGEPMLVACLWSHWVDPAGKEPDLLSFAAITDDPEPEVAEAGHDQTIINIKPEHVDAWLNPNPADLGALYAIFDDKRPPFYEHQAAA